MGSYNKPCFVYFVSDTNKCFLRDWCNSNANGCEYDSFGTEAYHFSTYIQKAGSSPTQPSPTQPSPTQPTGDYTEYRHWNCYEGRGGSHSDAGFQATRYECASYNKPCYVYLSSQGKCFLRDWCNSNAYGCEYGTPGTESWYFSTYIRTSRNLRGLQEHEPGNRSNASAHGPI